MHLRPDGGSRSVRNLPGGYEAGGLSCAAGAAHGFSNSKPILLPHMGNVPSCARGSSAGLQAGTGIDGSGDPKCLFGALWKLLRALGLS